MTVTIFSDEQMRQRAKRRLPGFAFDLIDGGAGRERSIRRNVDSFAAHELVPRVLRGGPVDTRVRLFGQEYAAPFGIAPMGVPALAWPGADTGMAQAAAAADIPIAVSTAASATIEAIAAEAPGRTWFQLYQAADPDRAARLLDRVEAAGVNILVLTVDRPVVGWRTRDMTNGVGLNFQLNMRAIASLAAHPRWSLATLLAGRPSPSMLAPQPLHGLTWQDFEALRARWPHRVLIKGILHPEDARRAAAAGADGVIISNHGGAHLESAAVPLDQLSAIRAAVGPDYGVLLDSGVRSGEDIVKALALGADFVLIGRAFMYSVAALGPTAGPTRMIDILKDQFTRALALMGCHSPADLTPEHLTSALR